jgi:outer membrane receptor for ferric coprogen and ferric-rhodotorulic acid
MTLTRVLLLCATASLAAAFVRAATPITPANPTPTTEEVIALSPFTVSDKDDKSWQATTTLIGSRTNQELIKVPVNVDVITSEFMRDLGAFSLEDAARFVAGVDVTPRLEARNDERVNYRGLSTGGASRNFFTWYVPSDSYNVERYDFAKGSNSLCLVIPRPAVRRQSTRNARVRGTRMSFLPVTVHTRRSGSSWM